MEMKQQAVTLLTKTALLVDGDNICTAHASQLLQIAKQRGRADIARVYTDTHHQSNWLAEPGFRLVHAGTGKNSADMLLSIDAMEMALEQGVTQFVIATSDGGFIHLAQRLRERGLRVFGVGEDKTSEMFRQACSEFSVLGGAKKCVKESPVAQNYTDMDIHIRKVISRESVGGRGIRVQTLGTYMNQPSEGIRISEHPEKTWRKYLSLRPHLYDLDPKGPHAMVRFIPEGFDKH
jgi:uncharacterized LabA/DUF88 family protein